MAERFIVHEHSYCEGPYLASSPKKIAHSHAEGARGHLHTSARSLGPASFSYGKPKFSPHPIGEQLPYVERTFEESHFEVIFVDSGYSSEHERSGISREDWTTHRDAFIQVTDGPMPESDEEQASGAAVQRLINRFDLTPIYRYAKSEGDS